MSITKQLIVGAGVLISTVVGGGIASADPDIAAIVNTTCTYPQVAAALQDQAPDTAAELNASPIASAWIQQLLASPPAKRREMVNEAQAYPQAQQYTPLINQVARTCKNY